MSENYNSAPGLGKYMKAKYSPTLKYDECTQAFAYCSQLNAYKKKLPYT